MSIDRKCFGGYRNACCSHLLLFGISKCLFNQALKWNMIDRAALLFPYPHSCYFTYSCFYSSLKIQTTASKIYPPGLPFSLAISNTFLVSFARTLPPPNNLALPLQLLGITGIHLLPVVLFFCILWLLPWCLAKPARLHLPKLSARHILSFQIKRQRRSPLPGRQEGALIYSSLWALATRNWLLSASPSPLLLVKCVSSPFPPDDVYPYFSLFPISLLSWLELVEVLPLGNWYFWVG